MWNLNMGQFFGGNIPQVFEKEYQCYSVSFLSREDLEKGNKILLPQSALHQLARLNISWPMLFEISNSNKSRLTHCGVMEFISPEGCCHIPYWMMQNLMIDDGDLVKIRNVSLPKGTFVKLKPLNKDFLEMSKPKAVLEFALRNYATLTVGDTIAIKYLNKTYEIIVVELKPANAITIIETDMEVEFEYEEESPQPPAQSTNFSDQEQPLSLSNESSNTTKSNLGQRLDGKVVRDRSQMKKLAPHEHTQLEEPWKAKLPNGVRTFCAEYDELIKEGRIPGVVGKAKARSDQSDQNFDDIANSNLFTGKGRSLGS